jgi:hypothetical protein
LTTPQELVTEDPGIQYEPKVRQKYNHPTSYPVLALLWAESLSDSNFPEVAHRLIDFAASELESYQKGCRKQQGWKPAKSRSFLQRFGRSERISLLIDRAANTLHSGQLVRPVSAQLALYR